MVQGAVRGLFVMGANPVGDRPDLQETFENLDLLVVQDLFMTETARFADAVLPAASFAEQEGTFTNTERRVQHFQKAFDPPGVAKPDWQLLSELARLAGKRFAYAYAEAVMDEISAAVPIYADMTYRQLGVQSPFGTRTRGHFVYEGTSFVNVDEAGRQWPVVAEDPDARLEVRWLAPPELPPAGDDEAVLLVPQKRLYDDGTLIEHSRILEAWVPAPLVYVSQADADRFGVQDGDMVNVVVEEESVTLTARVNDRMPAGVALIPLGLQGAEIWKLDLDRQLVHGRIEPVKEPVPVSD